MDDSDLVEKMVWASTFGAAWVRLSDPMNRPITTVSDSSILWRRDEAKRLADEAVEQYRWACPEGRD
jgi:hypothetical protein